MATHVEPRSSAKWVCAGRLVALLCAVRVLHCARLRMISPVTRMDESKQRRRDLLEGPEITAAEAVLDNGRFGTRTIRFETGRLAQQAQGSVAAYLDGE